MKIKRIDHFVLVTQDLQKCLDFYMGVLGLKHICKNSHHALKFGKSKINIHTKKGEFEPYAKSPEIGSADFCLITDKKIGKIKKKLNHLGVQIELGIVGRNGALGVMKSIYLRDPDGNLVEIASYK